ncbi:MAG: DUF6069 family protein [Pseudonocardiaceae bacterium]
MSPTDHTVTDQTGSAGAPPRNRLRAQRRGLSWWQAIAAAAVAATAGNLLILLAGRAAGASFELVDRGDQHVITAVGVITATVPPLVAGTALAALLGLWWPGFIRVAQVIGGGLALLTVAGPLMTNADTGTRLALALMHLVVGVAVVLSLEALWRRTKARPAQ